MNQEPEDGEAPEEIEIKHERSNQYSNHVVTGALISGPTSDGLYHLTFYSDTVKIIKETGYLTEVKKESGSTTAQYQSVIKREDTKIYREDRVNVAMNEDAMLRLLTHLQRHFRPKDNEHR